MSCSIGSSKATTEASYDDPTPPQRHGVVIQRVRDVQQVGRLVDRLLDESVVAARAVPADGQRVKIDPTQAYATRG